MTRFTFKPLLTGLVLALLLAVGQVHARYSAEPQHEEALLDVISALQQSHYSGKKMDEQLSSDIFVRYLKDLDPSRIYLYQADIREFEHAREAIGLEILMGNTHTGFAIYNRFHQRQMERLEYMLDILQDESHSFDFNTSESIETDRTEADWVETTEEMEQLWYKRLKNALISLKLADQSVAEARETLIQRYENQINRLAQTNNEDVFERYANAIAHEFDPHSQYLSPRNQENFQINMSLSLEGIGAVLQGEDEHTKVVRLVPGGPADLAGQLKPSDTIIGVGQDSDGPIQDVIGWRLDEVVNLIRGPRESTVRLQIIPADSMDRSAHRVITIVRDKVRLEEQAAQKRILDLERNGQPYRVGVIEIPAFYIDFTAMQAGDPEYKSTTRDVEELIEELKSENIDSLIVDLRNNGGGSLREANELTGLFISRGPTVQIRDASGRVDILGDFDPKVAWNGPIAVIVNRLSASASEIFAGAIQDYNRGLVVGSRTFGKGTVQTLLPLEHGQMKLTHAKFYRISGESTQNEGVQPHILFPTLFDEKDIGESALEGALPWDTVNPVRHGRFPSLTPFLDELISRHEARIANDPDFTFMHKQVERSKEQRQQTQVPLNITEVRAQRDEVEQWQVDTENQRRMAKDEPPIRQLSELDDLLPKDAQGRPINPEAESILMETAEIMVDFIDLHLSHTAQAMDRTVNGN
ncbi:peptidase S41 [Nitrincola sp. A-D6]|uniref:carboxy terminal-processing peptidase n=1 Tax=Nitrincola sp. A-D6 TaxID=1545442 RepID=UPI00051FA671|nr:carboxy terminal-processing peptidase [Nitrincola sp. A-D6]KGK41744.1 peptidase S41 [Nitrincola sp. A-D6]